MNRSRRHYTVMIAVVTTLFAAPIVDVAAEDRPDRLGISLGPFRVDSIDVTAAAVPTGRVIPAGAVINLNRNLGVEDSDDSFRLDGYYRFAKRHRIDWSYYRIKVAGERTIQEGFEWDGQQYEAGMRIASFWETTTVKLGYLFSFHHDNKVELGIGGGLHITDLTIGLDILAFATGQDPTQFQRSAALNATAPVPYLDFMIDYYIGKRWSFNWKYDALRLSYEDISGVMIDSLVSIEHRTFKHVGFGFGWNAFRINIDGTSGDTDYVFKNEFDGVLLYVKGYL